MTLPASSNHWKFTTRYLKGIHLISLLLIHLSLPNCNGLLPVKPRPEHLTQDPFEAPYFQLKSDGKGFNTFLKYPPFLRCIVPQPIFRRNVSDHITSEYPRNKFLKKWRIYWSNLWSAHFFDDEDVTISWEFERAKAHPHANLYTEDFFPILTLTAWICLIVAINLVVYPLISFVIFQLFIHIWLVISHKNVRHVFRYIIVKRARLGRNHVLRVFQDSGHRPPLFRYNLPKLVRLNVRDAVPKEMDETDEEFWLSDEETGANSGGVNEEEEERFKRFKATPDFTPEYPDNPDETPAISDQTFTYFVEVKKHGMFAVWTSGLPNIELDEISLANIRTKKSKKKFIVHGSIKSHDN